ncbi:MAG TPA: methyltransferase domain-containing protein [Methylomirabilota bacterium]|nr:methyltransferase domain-containing protein [Methylomirabilota bacterium]
MTARACALRFLVLSLAGAIMACAGAPESPRFPSPNRPVARIVSPAYTTEDKRDGLGEAERVMARLGVKPGLRVADVGAGEGYYTVRLARRLGPGAIIYAQDVEASYLQQLERRLQREGVLGVTLVHGTPRDPRLPPASIDLAILSHMYHEIENPYEFVYRLRAALAEDARVAVIDVDRPTQDHGTPPTLLRCELAAVGYRAIDFVLLTPADGYLAVFVPPPTLPPPDTIKPCAQ